MQDEDDDNNESEEDEEEDDEEDEDTGEGKKSWNENLRRTGLTLFPSQHLVFKNPFAM